MLSSLAAFSVNNNANNRDDDDGDDDSLTVDKTNQDHQSSSSSSSSRAPRSSVSGTSAMETLLLPHDDVLTAVGLFLHPRDVTQAWTCVNKATAARLASHHEMWKALWYRDYGNVLLQWPISRQAMRQSLLGHLQSTVLADSLERHLSQRLDEIPLLQLPPPPHPSQKHGMTLRDFYFVFGEVYMNYLLAKRNHVSDHPDESSCAKNDCYMGLHGHVVDFGPFASYHPGLLPPILTASGGRDATDMFESLPHSKGARAIAAQLVVLSHGGTMTTSHHHSTNDSSASNWGLRLRTPPNNLHQLLRMSNSRPLGLCSSLSSSDNDQSYHYSQLFPTRARSRRRRIPSLARIRREWDAKIRQQQLEQRLVRHSTLLWSTQSKDDDMCIYFDPLRLEWLAWSASENHK